MAVAALVAALSALAGPTSAGAAVATTRARPDQAAGPAEQDGSQPATGSAMRTDTERPVLAVVPAADAPSSVTTAPGEAQGPAPGGAAGSTQEDEPSTAVPTGERLETGTVEADPFVLIGAGYRSASATPGQVRVRTDGAWGAWTPLEIEPDHAADAGRAEAGRRGPADRTGAPVSEPLWVDHGDAYQLDLPGDASGVEVFLVRETGRPVELSPATVPLGDGPANEAAGEPGVRLRSSWGPRPYRGTPEVSPPLRRAIVHHTVNTNSYSAGQVPGLLRSIQAYHQDARGWDDIGYNFVIDRFGGIWEARAGGIRNPVVGAHAMNHNAGSVGVSFLGDATSSVTSAAVRAYGQLIGWKLFLGGVRPGTANVIGHRDVGQTSCPGSALYNSLGQIRALARAKYDALVGPGAFASRSVAVAGTYTPLSGDFNGDAYGDVLWYGPAAAADRLWLGGPDGFVGRSVTVNGTYRPAVGDFNGDGRSDVLWYGPGAAPDSAWFGRTDGGFTAKAFTIGSDYQPVAGDFNGDGRSDVLWYGSGTARDYLWYGTSAENFTGRAVTVNGTYSPFSGDFDGDQRSDVLWYGTGPAADTMWFGASGGFTGRSITIDGTYVPLVADVTGGGADDILWYGPGGAADALYLGGPARAFSHRSVAVNGVYDAPFTGDWNADGRGDVFWYRPSGTDLLWLGTG